MKKLLCIGLLFCFSLGLTGCLEDKETNKETVTLSQMFIGNKKCGTHGYTSNILSLYSDGEIVIQNAHYDNDFVSHQTSSYTGSYTIDGDKLLVDCINDEDSSEVSFEVELTTSNNVTSFTEKLELGIQHERVTYNSFELSQDLKDDTSIVNRYVSAGSSDASILSFEIDCTCVFLYFNNQYVYGKVDKSVDLELTFTFNNVEYVVDFEDENFFTLTYNETEYIYMAY